jgi:hypothetical protein
VNLKRWRRTEIRVERREVTLIVSRAAESEQRCPHCAGNSALLRVAEAVRVLGIDQPTLVALLEARKIHGSRSPDGQWLICAESIAQKE